MINNPAKYDINVYQDRDFSNSYIIKDESGVLIDIEDWTLTAQIRPAYDSDILLATFTITKDVLTATITTKLTDTVTRAMTSTNLISLSSTTTSSNMVWDLVVDTPAPASERFTLITGICNFYDTVTRAV